MEFKDIIFTWVLGIWSAFLAFFYPIHSLLILVLITFITNIFSGYIKGVIENKIRGVRNLWYYFSADKIQVGIRRMIVTFCFIMFLYYFTVTLFDEAQYALYTIRLSVFIVLVAHVKKICENFDIIVGGNMFTSIFDKISRLFEKKVTEQITDINEKEQSND